MSILARRGMGDKALKMPKTTGLTASLRMQPGPVALRRNQVLGMAENE